MIKPSRKKITIDNGEKIVKDFWVQQEKDNFIGTNTLFLSHSQLRELVKLITRKNIYIQTNKELDYEFIEILNQLWGRGINIYLLTDKLYNSYKDTIVGKVLIRYSNNINGDLILIDGNTTVAKGFISDSSNFNKEKKYFGLSSSQVEECYELYVYKFWKKTDFECIDEETFISPIETQEAPFDIFPKLNSKGIICDDYLSGNIVNKLDELIRNTRRKITLIINKLDIEDILLQKIAEKQEDNIKIEIITNITKGLQDLAPLFYPIEDYDIYGTEREIFPMVIIDDSIVILFTDKVKDEILLNSLCIVSNEKAVLEKVLNYKNELLFNEKTYYYNNEMILKKIAENKIITDINNISSSVKIIKEVEEIHGEAEVCESLLDLYNEVSKKDIVCDNKYTKVINYSYDLMPKYRDKSLNKDKLYDMWEGTYDNIERYSNELIMEISTVVSENSGLLSNIISFFDNNKVNSKNIVRELKDMLRDLSNRNYSLNELQDFDRILKKSYNDYLKLNSDIADLKDYKEQSEKWTNKRKGIEDNIEELDSKLSLKEKEIKSINDILLNDVITKLEEEIILKEIELDEMKDNIIKESNSLKIYFNNIDRLNSLKMLVDTAKLKKKKDIDKVIDKTKETVNSIFNDENYFDNVYKNRINNAKNAATLTTLIRKVILNELNEFINKDLTEIDKMGLEIIESLKIEIYDLNEKLKEEKNKSNSNELNKKLTSLQKELQNLESSKSKLDLQLQQLGDKFEYKPSNKEVKALNVKRYDVKLINEELPKTGVLYSSKNYRQLAIKQWGELDLGIKEAERLKAELVCEI